MTPPATVPVASLPSLAPKQRRLFMRCPGCGSFFNTTELAAIQHHERCQRPPRDPDFHCSRDRLKKLKFGLAKSDQIF